MMSYCIGNKEHHDGCCQEALDVVRKALRETIDTMQGMLSITDYEDPSYHPCREIVCALEILHSKI